MILNRNLAFAPEIEGDRSHPWVTGENSPVPNSMRLVAAASAESLTYSEPPVAGFFLRLVPVAHRDGIKPGTG